MSSEKKFIVEKVICQLKCYVKTNYWEKLLILMQLVKLKDFS